MIRVFILGLFLFYYWYFYFCFSKPLQPPSGDPEAAPNYKPKFVSDKPRHFKFRVNHKTTWNLTLPEPYVIQNGIIQKEGVCNNIPDGQSVLAKGKNLYDYLKENLLSNDLNNFRENSKFINQKGNVFYFKCQKGLIDSIHICPSGSLFCNTKKECIPMDACTGQTDGTKFKIPLQTDSYVECVEEKETIQKCPPDHFFLFDKCHHKKQIENYCEVNQKDMLIDNTTKIKCEGYQAIIISCPKNYQFLSADGVCEPMFCFGKPDGSIIGLPEVSDGTFKYTPGFFRCKNDKIDSTIQCPTHWDPIHSKNGNLTHLPMVYDGTECTIPIFCENVYPENSNDTIVPRYEFSKYVSNWKLSPLYDKLFGYKCSNGKLHEVAANDGYIINDQFRIEFGCKGKGDKVPIAFKPNEYFDCDKNQKITCNPGEQFQKDRCQWIELEAFQYKGVYLFHFSNLNSYDQWIKTWNYSHNPSPEPCPNTEPIYLKVYNICSHPDCVHYPFLSQIPALSLLLPDKSSKCTFVNTFLKKEPHADYKYTFWNQRPTYNDIPLDEEKCKPGQKLQTNNFIWDSTVYATCNIEQPFVFCPSPHTEDIERVEGNKFVCKLPDNLNSVLYTNIPPKTLTFLPNELKRIRPFDPLVETLIQVDPAISIKLPPNGYTIPERKRFMLYNITHPVYLDFRYRMTYPPNAVYKDGVVKIELKYNESAFITKQEDFTLRSVQLEKHEPIPIASDFDVIPEMRMIN